ncbi:MAG: NAD-dependent succinate-semialdehyde dehydrogenase [Candidatus Pelagibacter sp. TMED253]|nr:MAG: NAD-dependent succinate-semialdehyde dehydrogenase [Candidatus Pelagibacter sp. TMED253]
MLLKSIDPSTGHELATYKEFSTSQINQVLENSLLAQLHWKETSLEFRLDHLNEMIGVLSDGRREFSILMAHEMGKPLSQAEGEIEKCIWLCEYYRDNSLDFLKDKIIEHDTHKCFVTIQPLGLILGIMPWNFPFWQVFRFAIPTIITGNSAILKHASNVQGCGFEIENCFKKAGFPDNLFCNISVSGKNTEFVIKDSRISAVTITGSTPAGRSVARVAGENLKKTVLELGGSDPYLILDDANIDKAVDACINGRILNAGQSCISAKRIIATERVYFNIQKKLEQKLSEKIMGDPFDEVDIGPMVSIASRDEVHDQVLMSIKSGALLLLGGSIPNIKGAFYPITLLADVKPGMVAFDEEIFGPVFSLIMAKDEDHAIDLANNTPFGLGAAIFTENIEKGQDIAKNKIEAGVCFVNDFVKSDPRLPFGGVKESGYGRELSIHGMMEFVNVKTIAIAKD